MHRAILFLSSFLLLLPFVFASSAVAEAPSAPAAVTSEVAAANGTTEVAAAPKVIVHYLHGTARCTNCIKFEKWGKAALDAAFADEIKSGRLEWRMFNTDEDAHAHFVEEFQLYTKAIVLGEMKDGKVTRFRNLDKIWDHLRDETAFKAYIAGETRAFLDGK